MFSLLKTLKVSDCILFPKATCMKKSNIGPHTDPGTLEWCISLKIIPGIKLEFNKLSWYVVLYSVTMHYIVSVSFLKEIIMLYHFPFFPTHLCSETMLPGIQYTSM